MNVLEVMKMLPHVTGFQHFDINSGMRACCHFLPERRLDSFPDLLGAVAHTLGQDPNTLRLLVHDVVQGNDRDIQTAVKGWLMNYGITKKQYLRNIVNRHHAIDSLSLWLSVNVAKKYLNILHVSGVWTSHRSGITVLTDATMVLLLNYCLATHHMTRDEIKKSVYDKYTIPL